MSKRIEGLANSQPPSGPAASELSRFFHRSFRPRAGPLRTRASSAPACQGSDRVGRAESPWPAPRLTPRRSLGNVLLDPLGPPVRPHGAPGRPQYSCLLQIDFRPRHRREWSSPVAAARTRLPVRAHLPVGAIPSSFSSPSSSSRSLLLLYNYSSSTMLITRRFPGVRLHPETVRASPPLAMPLCSPVQTRANASGSCPGAGLAYGNHMAGLRGDCRYLGGQLGRPLRGFLGPQNAAAQLANYRQESPDRDALCRTQ